jgi:putative salt-induced outer membrane protein
VSYTVDYNSNPPVGAVSTDTLTRFTLVYGF